MSIWTDLGFSESPYATTPIPASELGESLLVGRSREIEQLKSRISGSALHPTIEGDNGVGKTSLVSIASYRLQRAFEEGTSQEALLPVGRPFQLDPNDTLTSLTSSVLYEVAQAILRHRDLLRRRGYAVPDVESVDRWLNSPVFSSRNVGLTIGNAGFNYGYSSAPNESAGFSDAGFVRAVTEWLRQCFPTRQAGGLICVIDNLELLETTQRTRSLLESMRDSLLDLPGLRWVLCGSRGIVRSGAASPRLEGRLGEPMDLRPISDDVVDQVVEQRILHLRVRDDAVAPVDPPAFRYIYDVLHRNLRNALKFSEDFAFWLFDQDMVNSASADRRALLEVWLTSQADEHLAATRLSNRAWRLFDELAEHGESVSPSEFSRFGFNSPQAMRPHIKSLEDAKLVVSAIDETDARRKTIDVTPRGWLVRYARAEYRVP